MAALSARQAYASAAVVGATLWVGTSLLSGRREAWDASAYWMLAYPAAILIAGVLGYLAPTRPWRWAATLMGVQAACLTTASGSFGLLPLGLILFGFLALPPMGAAAAGARYRLRQREE